MVDEWETINEKRNKFKTIIVVTLVAISIVIITTLTLSASWTEPIMLQQNPPTYTTNYTSISPEEAYNMVYNSTNPIIIVDARNCDCAYKDGHIIGAIWKTSPLPLYDTLEDTLIYCEDGEQSSRAFCEKFIGHTYGQIYHLDGGIEAWEEKGYRTTKL